MHSLIWAFFIVLLCEYFDLKANRTTEGTYPVGSEWTMVPIPVCNSTDMGWLNPDCLNGFEFEPRGTGQGPLYHLKFGIKIKHYVLFFFLWALIPVSFNKLNGSR